MHDALRGFFFGLGSTFGLLMASLPPSDSAAPSPLEEERSTGNADGEAPPAAADAPEERCAGLAVAASPAAETDLAMERALRREWEEKEPDDIEIDIDVRVVDAETGADVKGATWRRLGQCNFCASLEPGIRRLSKENMGCIEAGWDPICASAPAGYVAWEDGPRETPMSIYTTGARAILPLRPEVDCEVEIVGPYGRAEENVRPEYATMAGKSVAAKVETLGGGRWRIPGVPHLSGEPLDLALPAGWTTVTGWEPDLGEVLTDVVLGVGRVPADRRTPLRVRLQAAVREPPFEGPDLNSHVGIGGRGCGYGSAPHVDRPRGEFEIRVTRADGRPAASATVVVWGLYEGWGTGGRRFDLKLDEKGTGSVDAVPAGPYTATLFEVGLMPVTTEFDVTKGERRSVFLREPEGGAIQLHITDAAGRPLPFARFAVRAEGGGTESVGTERVAWVDLDPTTGVQRIDDFVDESGYRPLRRVAAGDVVLRATWGSKSGDTGTRVREGITERVTLVLK